MARPVLYLAITAHGFGHAVRMTAIAAEIQRLNPEILLILVTTAPRWLLEGYLRGEFIHRPRGYDVGAIQSDSLQIDRPGTLARLLEIRAQQDRIIASEVDFIRTNGVGLILADIPPLAAAIARAAGIPCWMTSNFGWDFIYRDWGGEFRSMAEWMAKDYGTCDRLLRLPLHEPMTAFPHIEDVGLTGGTPFYAEWELRDNFRIRVGSDRLVLLSFGGLGLEKIPYHNLQDFPDWQFITFDKDAPNLDNLIKVTSPLYRPIDFMPLCGQVMSKPGYSTFSEALRLQRPLITITREGFAEANLLIEGLQDYGYHQVIPAKTFFEGNWDFLLQSPQPPRRSESLATDGNEAIAQAVLSFFQS